MSEPEMFNEKDVINSFLKKQFLAAADGDGEAAEELIVWALMCIKENRPFPEPLQDYLAQAFTAIIKRENNADKAFLLKHGKKGPKRNKAAREREENIAYFITRKMKDGVTLEDACEIVSDNKIFGIKADAAKKIYLKNRGIAKTLMLLETWKVDRSL